MKHWAVESEVNQGFSWGELGPEQSWRGPMWLIIPQGCSVRGMPSVQIRIKIIAYFSPLTLVIVTSSDVIYWMPSVFNWRMKHGVHMGHLPMVSGIECVSVFLSFPSPTLPLLPPLVVCALWDHSFTGRPWQFALGNCPLGVSCEEPTGVELVFVPASLWKAASPFLPSGKGWPRMPGWSYSSWEGLVGCQHNKVNFTHSVETCFHWLTALEGRASTVQWGV